MAIAELAAQQADRPSTPLALPALEVVGGVAVISPQGALDHVLPADFVSSLETAASSGPMIVDLTAAVLTNRDTAVGLAAVIAATAAPGEYCFVSARATGRQLLRTWGVARCGAVFGSVQDALQARQFLNDSYGDGWAPQLGPRPHT